MDEVEERSKDFRDSSSEIHENETSPAKPDSALNKTITSNSSDGQQLLNSQMLTEMHYMT